MSKFRNVIPVFCVLGFLSAQTLLGATHQVHITKDFVFSPEDIQIVAGDTIEFINDSNGTHTVTADPARVADINSILLPNDAAPFHSGSIDPSKTPALKLETVGDYQYVCLPHEFMGMTGRVRVAAAPVEPLPKPAFACVAKNETTSVGVELSFLNQDGFVVFDRPLWGSSKEFKMTFDGASIGNPNGLGIMVGTSQDLDQPSLLFIEWEPGSGAHFGGYSKGKMLVGDQLGRLLGKHLRFDVSCEPIAL